MGPVALCPRGLWTRPIAKIALHSPQRPGRTYFVVKPAARIDNPDAGVNTPNLCQCVISNRLNDQHFYGAYESFSASATWRRALLPLVGFPACRLRQRDQVAQRVMHDTLAHLCQRATARITHC